MALPSSSADIAAGIKSLLKEISDERGDAARLDELRRLFAGLIQEGDLELGTSSTGSSASVKWKAFLRQSHKRMVNQLCERIKKGKKTAVRTLWGVVATSSLPSSNGKYRILSADLLLQWVRAMSKLPAEYMDKSMRHMLQAEFLHPYRDAQYYVIIAITTAANELVQQEDQNNHKEERAERLLQILTMIPIPANQDQLDSSGGYLLPPPENPAPDTQPDAESDEDENETSDEEDVDSESEDEPEAKKQKVEEGKDRQFAFQQVQAHHRVWSKAWMALLRLPLPHAALKQALQFLPEHVLLHVANPLRFSDFFMAAYESTGVIPLLALDGLFLLMTQHGLEYPDFYKQLYSLITPSLLYVKYRARFFRLLDKCLSRNEMLPAHVVAAFVKRLMRCSLNAPPSSILFVLALCSNLLRKHPETTSLIHRTTEGEGMHDIFDAMADDPEQANALQSSLWELGALSRHYYPAVVTLATSIGREEELNTPLHNLEDFMGHTSKSLFEQERKRKQKRKTPLTFVEPESLFCEHDAFSGILAVPRLN